MSYMGYVLEQLSVAPEAVWLDAPRLIARWLVLAETDVQLLTLNPKATETAYWPSAL